MNQDELKFIKSTTLYMKNISKTFGSNKALNDVELLMMPGEVMGLLGKNGCGKSTLIKILSGYHQPDDGGELYVNGKKVSLPLSPGEFQKYGMSFVHQDLGLVDSLSVIENWLLSEISTTNQMKIQWRLIKKDIEETFKQYGLSINPEALVSSLSPVQKAMFAILRAVVDLHEAEEQGRGLLVLDEPTVFLPKAEVEILFRLIRSVAQEGISVMFVSHDLDEVISLTDSFTVLRDGQNAGIGTIATVDKNSIIKMILGENLNEYHIQNKSENDRKKMKTILSVSNVEGNMIKPLSFSACSGEVLGITGLVGSGFEEIPYLLFGNVPGQRGKLRLHDKEYDLENFSPQKAVNAQMALIPADRKNNGGVLSLEINDNIMMQAWKNFNSWYLDRKLIREKAEVLMKNYTVYPNDLDLEFGMLSGGNQQKVLLAKWIQENPDLLILHEPTQGIDIGARQAIYTLIEDSVQKNGMSVICSSSDYEQLEQICDRVLILVNGQIIEELVGDEITKARITEYCYASEQTGKEGAF